MSSKRPRRSLCGRRRSVAALFAAALLAAALPSMGCATVQETRELYQATGVGFIATGVVGGVLVGTSVIYDPQARDDDGGFVPVADQPGESLWPWGAGIAAIGVVGGSALFVAAALLDEEEPAAATDASAPSRRRTGPAPKFSPPRKTR